MERLTWIDQLRGFAILQVVIGHLIHFNGFGVDNSLAEIIWSFHMPLFFAISGFIAERTTQISKFSEYIKFAKKKIIAIGLPWIVWGLFINKWFFTSEWPTYTITEILGFWNSTWLWFFGALLWTFLIYGLHKLCYQKLDNNKILAFIFPFFITLILTAVIVLLKLRDINMFLWAIGFYTGVLWGRYKKLYNIIQSKSIVVVALLVFVILSGHWRWYGSTIDDVYKIICSTSAIIVLFYFFSYQQDLIHNKIAKMLELFGTYSLSIYVLQFYMTAILPQQNMEGINSFILYMLCSFIGIIICFVCTWIAKYIQHFPFLDFFLLGNHKIHLFPKDNICKK